MPLSINWDSASEPRNLVVSLLEHQKRGCAENRGDYTVNSAESSGIPLLMVI